MRFKRLKLNMRERKRFDTWSKESIYEAYLQMHKRLLSKTAEVKRLKLIIAGLELDMRRAGVEIDTY